MFFIALSCLFSVTAFSFTPNPEQKKKTFTTELVAAKAIVSFEMQSVSLSLLGNESFVCYETNSNKATKFDYLSLKVFEKINTFKSFSDSATYNRKINLYNYNKPNITYTHNYIHYPKDVGWKNNIDYSNCKK